MLFRKNPEWRSRSQVEIAAACERLRDPTQRQALDAQPGIAAEEFARLKADAGKDGGFCGLS